MLEHLQELSMSADETLTIMLIDYMNQHQLLITHEVLGEKLKKGSSEVDEILSQLSMKGYLSLDFKNGKLFFNIDGVFEDKSDQQTSFDVSLFELYEAEFKRPLSQIELQRLSDWMQLYDQKLIGYALREAITYNVLSFDYIDKILSVWKENGLTAEKYEEGDR